MVGRYKPSPKKDLMTHSDSTAVKQVLLLLDEEGIADTAGHADACVYSFQACGLLSIQQMVGCCLRWRLPQRRSGKGGQAARPATFEHGDETPLLGHCISDA